MEKFFKKTKKKQWLFIGGFLFVFLFSFLIASPVEANWATQFFGWIFAAIVYILGLFLVLLIEVLIYIASYNNFLGVPAITVGWSMVRDLANMFFVVILLIIAFATILPGIEKYNYKKWLPKLILMAVLINFSKTICGLLIDVAQVVMLSFVSAFANISGTNITHMLGILDWHKLDEGSDDVGGWEVMGAYFLAVVYVVISIVVIGAMLMMLVMRIVMIWIYVILSPLAFLLNSFPDGSGYASKWWKQFTQNLVIGPVLAFFIWLSFSIVSVDVSGTQVLGDNEGLGADLDSHEEVDLEGDDHGFGSGDLMIQFIVSIGLLIGGLKVSQEIGGEAGNVLGKASQKGFGIAKQLGKKAGKAGVEGTKFVGRQSLGAGSQVAQWTGKKTRWKGLKTAGDIGQAMRGDIKTTRKKAKVEKREKFLKNIGMGELSGDVISTKMKEAGKDKKYETMYKATEKMGAAPKRTRKLKEHFKKPENIGDFNPSDIIENDGEIKKGNLKELFSDEDVMKNVDNWLKNEGEYGKGGRLSKMGYSGDAKDLARAKSWQSAIEKSEEKEVDGVGNAASLKSTLKGMNLDTAVPKDPLEAGGKDSVISKLNESINKLADTMKSGKGGGIKYNKGGNNDLADNLDSSNVNQGKLFTNSFASGDKDALGISFNDLKAEGVDIDTSVQGANLNKERMGDSFDSVVDALENKISQAQVDLDQRKKSGSIGDKDYKKEMDNLVEAKNRLQSGSLENINLVNTANPKFGREMAMRNVYHEELHGSGLKDEYVTKTVENSLMENKLYGKNPETGNRHAKEIGQLASALKSEGKSDSEVIKSAISEIKNRSQNEASSRAERALKLENGKLETESQVSNVTNNQINIKDSDNKIVKRILDKS